MFDKAVCVIIDEPVIAASAPAREQTRVLYTPCSQWLRKAAADAGFSYIAEKELPEGDFEFALVLYTSYPFITQKNVSDAYACFAKAGKTLAITVSGETVGVFADATQLPQLLKQAPQGAAAFELGGNAPRIHDAKSHNAANEYARLAQIDKLLEDGVYIPVADGVSVSPLSKVAPGAVIYHGTVIAGESEIGTGAQIGPCSFVSNSSIGENTVFKYSSAFDSRVGANATVGPYTQLRPDSVLGDKVKVGDFVEIKNANIGNNTSVAHLTYIGDADVGKSCNFGCGVVVVNYDGENKYRTEIGDYSFVGCNTNLVAPVKLGNGAFTAAGATITKDVPAGALGISRVPQENREGWAERKLKKYTEKQKNRE